MIEIILLAAWIIMLALRIFGVMIPWIWVWAPIWIPVAGVVLILAVTYLPRAWMSTAGLARYFKEKRKHRKWRDYK